MKLEVRRLDRTNLVKAMLVAAAIGHAPKGVSL
jgi:hypothetical protein